MSLAVGDDSTFSCTTLRYLVDPRREITVPAGVILWSEKENQLWFRLPREGERIPSGCDCNSAPTVQVLAYLEIARDKIVGWHQSNELPYQREPHQPLSEGWWEEVRRQLQWRVRLGSVWSLVCNDPEAELARLYEALVQPRVAAESNRLAEPVPAVHAAD